MSNSNLAQERLDDLHQEFWTLTSILTVVSAVNNRGEAQMGTPVSQGSIYNGLLDNPSSINPLVVLNALAALIVRDTEVIAIAPCLLGPEEAQVAEGVSSPRVAEEAPPSPGGLAYQILACQESPDEWHAVQFDESFNGFAAINNTDTRDNHFVDASDPNRVALVPSGVSLWEEIKKDPWHTVTNAFPRRHISLASHIATLDDFITDLAQAVGKQETPTPLFLNMTHYLISCGWRKMKRRMDHWSSAGFLSTLTLSHDRVKGAFDRANTTRGTLANYRKDETLAKLFKALDAQEIKRILQNYPQFYHKDPPPTELPNLSMAFEEILREGSPQTIAYNTFETCIEFHQLLIALLFTYSKSLSQLVILSDSAEKKTKVNAFVEVWNMSHLLWRIAYSRTLRHHLMVLHRSGLISVPVESGRNTYEGFFNFTGLTSPETQSPSSDENPEENSLSGDEPDVDDMNNLNMGTQIGEVVTVYLRWIRLQVTHFVALQIISSFFQKHPKSGRPHKKYVDISLLAVRPPSHIVNTWETLIKDLSTNKFDAEGVITHIKNEADSAQRMGTASLYGRSGSILSKFSSPHFQHRAAVHCEAALAALAKYPTLAIKAGGSDMLKLLGNLDMSSISVSKLCCPVCWDLLAILRGDSELMQVRGRHVTISPIHLPDFLPSEVVESMVKKYRGYLLDELVKIASNIEPAGTIKPAGAKTHTRNFSGDSRTGLSEAGSITSGEYIMPPIRLSH